MQVDYLGNCLTGKVQEWFYRNLEQYDHQVHNWTLETVVQGLQKRFLHTLTHHHASNKFDMVSQGTKTIQEVLNNLKKYAAWMIHLPDIYMFSKWFVLALHDLLYNEVLKKAITLNSALSTSYMKLLRWLRRHPVIITGCGTWKAHTQQQATQSLLHTKLNL